MNEQEIKNEIVETESFIDTIRIIANADECIKAQKATLDLVRLEKKIKEYWKEPIEKANATHKALTRKRSEMLGPVEDRKKKLSGIISVYLTEQERIRQAEQDKIDEARRKKEQHEREKLKRAAERAAEKGNEEKAEELLEKSETVFIPPSIVQSEIEKTSRTETGTMSQKKELRVTITDPKKILKSILAGGLPVDVITVNEVKLKKIIELNNYTVVPGCVLERVIKPTFRGAR